LTRDIKRRVAAGETLIGAVIKVMHPTIVDLCYGGGANFLFLDFEHGLRDCLDLQKGLVTAELCRVPALVRIALRLCLTPEEAPMQMKVRASMLMLTHDVHLIKSMYSKLFTDFRGAVKGAPPAPSP
jgi:prepilin-type processing-associated H-X9-DG protein